MRRRSDLVFTNNSIKSQGNHLDTNCFDIDYPHRKIIVLCGRKMYNFFWKRNLFSSLSHNNDTLLCNNFNHIILSKQLTTTRVSLLYYSLYSRDYFFSLSPRKKKVKKRKRRRRKRREKEKLRFFRRRRPQLSYHHGENPLLTLHL